MGKQKKKNKNNENKTINLNEEIIIGLTPKKTDSVKKNKKNKSEKGKNKTSKNKASSKQKNSKPKNKESKKTNKKVKNKKNSITKWIILIILIILCIVLFLLSSIFNIKNIIVTNNSKVSSEEIILLSELNLETNMFKTSNKTIKNRIKANPYIEDVIIHKKINGEVILEVEERQASYMIQCSDTYAYINNQGYILELSTEQIEVPIIIGITTEEANIVPGNRLSVEDLEKLNVVIKIMSNATSLEIDKLITSIDISNKNDYIIRMETELKTIHFGDEGNINDKMPWVVQIMNLQKDVEGEIFVQNPGKNAYFREKV